PKIVHVEMNPHYPPPFAQRQHFDTALLEQILHTKGDIDLPNWVRGCSLSAISQVLGGPAEYALVQVEFDHALFVRKDLVHQAVPSWPRLSQMRLWDHWLAGFQCHPLRRIARESEREAGFDFRTLVPKESPYNNNNNKNNNNKIEAEMRQILHWSGGVERPVPSSLLASGLSPAEPDILASDGGLRIPFSLELCEECG
ncbi:unnamed protein product, partial [Polarella glacialis]